MLLRDGHRCAAVAAWVATRRSRHRGIAAEAAAGAGGKQRIVRAAGSLGEPGGQHRLGGGGEGHRALLAALALAADVGAGAERDAAAVESDELGDPQARLDRQYQQGAVAPAFPPPVVWRIDERFGLVGGEERDGASLEPLGRDGQHALDHGGVLGVAQRRVAEQRPDRREAQVAGPRPVAAVHLQVLEERGDQRLVEVMPLQRGGRLAGSLLHEAEQQPERVSV